jgi:uncharacterized integral membrane protein
VSSQESAPSSEQPEVRERPTSDRAGQPDPLRGSRTSGFWSAVLVLVVLLLLLAVFILQNTQDVQVSFLGWSGSAPLAASLLIAAVTGALVVAAAGALRILQLRRRVKRQRSR